MKMVFTSGQWVEPSSLGGLAYEVGKDAFNAWLLEKIHDIGSWLATSGLPMAAEFVMIWGLICLVGGITGSSKWMERGVKSVLISIFLGLVKYAI